MHLHLKRRENPWHTANFYNFAHSEGPKAAPVKINPWEILDKRRGWTDTLNPKSLLVQGIPGIGKSTLLEKMLLDWANMKVLSQFRYIFRFDMRSLALISGNISCQDLLMEHHPSKMSRKHRDVVWADICQNVDKVLLAFDGLDDYPGFDVNMKSPVPRITYSEDKTTIPLLLHNLQRHNLLKGASVLITASPQCRALDCFEPFDRTVSAMGYGLDQIKECAEKACGGNQERVEAVMSVVENNTHVRSLCVMPMFSSLISHWLCQTGLSARTPGNTWWENPQTFTQLMAILSARYAMLDFDKTKMRRSVCQIVPCLRDALRNLEVGLAKHGIARSSSLGSTSREHGDGRYAAGLNVSESHLVEGLKGATRVPSCLVDDPISHTLGCTHILLHHFLGAMCLLKQIRSAVDFSFTLAKVFKGDLHQNMLGMFLGGLATDPALQHCLGEYLCEAANVNTCREKASELLKFINGSELCQEKEGHLFTLVVLYEMQQPEMMRHVRHPWINYERLDLSESNMSPLEVKALGYFLQHTEDTIKALE